MTGRFRVNAIALALTVVALPASVLARVIRDQQLPEVKVHRALPVLTRNRRQAAVQARAEPTPHVEWNG